MKYQRDVSGGSIITMGILILAGFLTFSCSSPRQNKASFTIVGKMSNCATGKILLQEMDINKIIPLDSAIADPSGKFKFERTIDQDGFYFLRFPDGRKILLQLRKNEHVTVNGKCDGVESDFQIEGSQGSMILASFFRLTNVHKRKIDSLNNLVKEQEGSPDFPGFMDEIDNQFQILAEDQRKLELEIIENNPSSLASLIILNYSFGGRPVLGIDQDFSVYKWLDSCLQKSHSGNKHVDYHHKRVVEYIRQESILRMKKNQEKKD